MTPPLIAYVRVSRVGDRTEETFRSPAERRRGYGPLPPAEMGTDAYCRRRGCRSVHPAEVNDAGALGQLPAPAGIAFDLDGTLVDTVGARIDGWLEALAAAGMRTTRDEVAPMIGMDGKRLARDVAEANHRLVADDEIEEIDRAAGKAFDRLNTSPRPLPGAGDLLGAIEARGLRWLIATSSRAEQVTRSVAALGLAATPTIVDGSHVKRAKPAPDLLLLAAERLGAPADRCWSVGDATWDIRASRAAGVTAVGVLAGSAVDRSALEEAGAALVVETLSELVALLDGAGEH